MSSSSKLYTDNKVSSLVIPSKFSDLSNNTDLDINNKKNLK